MNDLRDVPITSGRPRSVSSSSRASSSRLCSSVLPKPIPGSSWIRSSATPAATANAHPLLEERLDVGDDVVVARIALHRARLAEHVHQAAVDAAVGDEGRPGPGRCGTRVTSLTYWRRRRPPPRRPRASSCRSRSAPDVARGPRPPRSRARAPRSAGTGSAPGRVDSPPTSMMSAPSATSRRPCAMAGRRRRTAPPSEKESGVTLTTPMISNLTP